MVTQIVKGATSQFTVSHADSNVPLLYFHI